MYLKKFATSFLCSFALMLPMITAAQGSEYIPGDIMVMLAPSALASQVVADLAYVDGKATGLEVVREVSAPMRAWLLHFDDHTQMQSVMLRALRSHPKVQMAQNNHIVKERVVPNDTQYAQQWHHQNIDSEAAWDISTGGLTANGDTIVVCIIENADLPHADLIDNAWFNHAEIPNNNIDDDGNGYVDDYRGWNTPGGNDNVYGGSHGTEVAGMIGATGNNSLGVVGANWNVKMMIVDYGGVQEAAVVAAYTYPLVMRRRYNESNGSEGAFVVATSASWGIDGGNPNNSPLWCAIYDTLGVQGVLSCGATSNNNVNVDVVGDLPTACGSDFMISVTATNISDNRTFSGYGLTTIDVGAPGDNVRTTQIGGGYGTTSGTSFACPLTAGVIGLLYSAPCSSLMSLVSGDPAAGALYVRDALFEGTEQVGNLGGQTVTGGRISAGNSMQLIMDGCGACPSPYNLGATQPAIGTADLVWSSTAGVEFDMQYRPVGTADWTIVNGLTAPQYTANALTACTQYEFQVSVACDSAMSEFSTSYLFVSEGCCNNPGALSITAITPTDATLNWGTILAAMTYDIRYAVQGTTTWTTVPALSASPFTIEGLSDCTGYQVQMRSTCNGGQSEWSSSLLFTTSNCGDCIDLTYCPSVGGTADEFIQSVVFGTINNVSGDDDGYGDHTGMSTTVYLGSTYPITMAPGFNGSQFGEWFSVYMDFDRNGSFANTERVYNASATTTAAVTANITIPATTVPGIVRMRVIMKYQTGATSGCTASFQYGEVEDYCVLVAGNVGVAEIIDGALVNVYPDPADDVVYFELTNSSAFLGSILYVVDPSGREVTKAIMQRGKNTLSTASFADGLYSYRIMNGGAEVVRGKLIVAH